MELVYRNNKVHLISSFQLRIKLAEDLLQLLTDHISKHIQTTSDDEQKIS